MSEIELFEVQDDKEIPIKEISFGRLIAGGPSVIKLFRIRVKDKVDDPEIRVSKLGDLKLSIGNLNGGEEADAVVHPASEGAVIKLTRDDGKSFLFAGDVATFVMKVTPSKGGSFSPEFEIRYLVVPKG